MSSSKPAATESPDYPSYLHRVEPRLPFDKGEEALYRRIQEEHLDPKHNRVLRGAFQQGVPRISVNRGAVLKEPNDCIGPYVDQGLVGTRVKDLPLGFRGENASGCHLVLTHTPEAKNYSHSELVYCIECLEAGEIGVAIQPATRGTDRQIRDALANASAIVKPPPKPTI